MPSIKDQLETYSQQGYLVIPNALEAVDVDAINAAIDEDIVEPNPCLLYTSPSPRDVEESRMPSSA